MFARSLRPSVTEFSAKMSTLSSGCAQAIPHAPPERWGWGAESERVSSVSIKFAAIVPSRKP